jgi:hypothetical protein
LAKENGQKLAEREGNALYFGKVEFLPKQPPQMMSGAAQLNLGSEPQLQL